MALTLATELINLAYERHSTHCLFIPKPNTRRCSASAVFPRDQRTRRDGADGKQRHATETHAESLKKFRHPGNKIGCIVMTPIPLRMVTVI